ncbi:MAG TPA: flagellar basal body rod protein FlgC [Hyphomonadaceae bacterium]|jgi:flagellar basal-body rod protein FlgC|nr:flagellar basal body rod protein FlgC [Hyphomonadaceae bacterium]HPN06494.1 flagellar basal body rod protein FlgC [Hyphomonadaceae bacterium]
MSSDLMSAMGAAATGLRAQTVRIRISAENLANADTTASTPGGDPYRRKAPVFRTFFDKEVGANTVKVTGAREDQSPFQVKYDPSHPAADATGYVKTSNVSSLIEMADLREAQRAYEANLNVIESSRAMMLGVVSLLKA